MTPEHTREAVYRYGGTYVRTAEGEVAYVYDRDEDDYDLLRVHVNDEMSSLPLAALDFTYPELGHINTETGVYFLTRSANSFINGNRMYKRGWERHTCIAKRISDLDSSSYPQPDSVFNPQYFSAKAAISEVLEGNRTAAAFSPSFSVAIMGERVHPVLFQNETIVGYAKEGVFYLPSVFDFIKPDLQHCCDVPVELIA